MKIFLGFYGIFKKDPLIRCLHISLLKRNLFFLKDICAKCKSVYLMKASTFFFFSFRISASITGPFFFFHSQMARFIIYRKSVFIICRTFFCINRFPSFVFMDLYRIYQLFFPVHTCHISYEPAIVVIYKSHSCLSVCITDKIPTFIQYLVCSFIIPRLQTFFFPQPVQIIKIQIFRLFFYFFIFQH